MEVLAEISISVAEELALTPPSRWMPAVHGELGRLLRLLPDGFLLGLVGREGDRRESVPENDPRFDDLSSYVAEAAWAIRWLGKESHALRKAVALRVIEETLSMGGVGSAPWKWAPDPVGFAPEADFTESGPPPSAGPCKAPGPLGGLGLLEIEG